MHLAETIILLSELNAIVAENQSEVTFRNVAAPSATTVADVETIVVDAETTVVEEGAMIADLVTKNNIIEMTGFVLHVRMTTSLSELNATNVENLGREEVLAEEIHMEATEEVATVADVMVIVADVMETVADVEATEEMATAEDAMVTVADVEATEEVASVADVMETVADVEMTVQTNSIERPVENDLAMLTIDHLRKSSHVDINDAMTMTTKVNI